MSTPAPSVEHLIEKIRDLPADRIAEVEDFVDFLRERAQRQTQAQQRKPFDFPVISVGQWPQDMNLSRKDMYGDDGR